MGADKNLEALLGTVVEYRKIFGLVVAADRYQCKLTRRLDAEYSVSQRLTDDVRIRDDTPQYSSIAQVFSEEISAARTFLGLSLDFIRKQCMLRDADRYICKFCEAGYLVEANFRNKRIYFPTIKLAERLFKHRP